MPPDPSSDRMRYGPRVPTVTPFPPAGGEGTSDPATAAGRAPGPLRGLRLRRARLLPVREDLAAQRRALVHRLAQVLRRRVAQHEEEAVGLLEVRALARRAPEQEARLEALRVPEARLVRGHGRLRVLHVAAGEGGEVDGRERLRPREAHHAREHARALERLARGVDASPRGEQSPEREEAVGEAAAMP